MYGVSVTEDVVGRLFVSPRTLLLRLRRPSPPLWGLGLPEDHSPVLDCTCTPLSSVRGRSRRVLDPKSVGVGGTVPASTTCSGVRLQADS